MKYIYNFDKDGYFTTQEVAYLDPEATKIKGYDVYFLPPKATFVAPTLKEGFIPKFDGTFWYNITDNRGKYYVTDTMQPTLIDKVGELGEGCVIITDEERDTIYNHSNYYIIENNTLVKNPNYEKEEQEKLDKEFNEKFFLTSLGYVRRDVTMQNGKIKDFLSDILPILKVGVPILTYTRELEQSKVLVTEEFLGECEQQVLIDFYGE